MFVFQSVSNATNHVSMNYLPFKIFYPKILFIENIYSLNYPLKLSKKELFDYLTNKLSLKGEILGLIARHRDSTLT